jgi:opacity protein-like surface antigen
MKSLLICSTTLLAAASLVAADKDDVTSAAQKLAGADNYSWTTTMESTQFKPGPSHGKTQKDGLVWQDFTMQDNTVEAYAKDGKGAIKTEDGWQSLEEAAKDDGGGGYNFKRFLAIRMQNFKAPAAQAEEIAGKTKDLTKTDDTYAGELTEEGAKSLLTFGRRGGQAPAVSNAKGSVKFWIKDGAITKYQTKVSGTTKNRDGEDMDIDRTTTVEIKDVGATKITVPDEVKSKMS